MNELDYSVSDSYINWLKKNEGLEFKPYESKEGGTPTVGFGHKLTAEEIKSGKVFGFDIKKIDKDAAETILRADLAAKQELLDNKLMNKFGISLNELDPTRKEMLLDYEFNVKGGINKFPKFTEAVLANDVETMRKEYVRKVQDPKTGKMIPLGERNKTFFDRYLKGSSVIATGVAPQQFAQSDDPFVRMAQQSTETASDAPVEGVGNLELTEAEKAARNAELDAALASQERKWWENPLTDWMYGLR